MTKIENLISQANIAIAYDNDVDILETLIRIRDELEDLQSKMKTVIQPLHESFLKNYYGATGSSDPDYYFKAALSAKSMQYEMKRVGILPNSDDEIFESVVRKF